MDITEQENKKNARGGKATTIDREQLEYTAEKLFTYGTVSVAVIGIYAAVIYLFVEQLKK
jgi:hypothetical protein